MTRPASTLRMIGGLEEARYGSSPSPTPRTIEDGFGLDMGGGSIQTHRASRAAGCPTAVSLPLGSVRVSEQFLPGEKATGRRA